MKPKKEILLPVTVTYNGQTKTIRQWAKENNMSYSTLYSRIKHGWPIEMAMDTSVNGANHWLIRKRRAMLEMG